MEYKLKNLKNKDQTTSVNVNQNEDGSLSLSMEDKHYNVSFSRISTNQLYLNVNGKCLNAYVAGNYEEKTVILNGVSYKIQDADLLERRPDKKGGAQQLSDWVTPPMPAVVVRILKSEGDVVERGQGVIIVSAMKMETTLAAPYDGVITKINVDLEEKVMPGQILVDIEKYEEN